MFRPTRLGAAVLAVMAIATLAVFGPQAATAQTEGVELLYSFEPGGAKIRTKGTIVSDDASHGTHSFRFDTNRRGGGKGRMARYCPISPKPNQMKSPPLLMAVPPTNDRHDVMQWYYERYGSLIDECGVANRMPKALRDWSAYDTLRFDVHAKDTPVILGISVRDGTGVRFRIGHTGVRSGYGIFRIPTGKWMTCVFPLAKLAKLANLDLTKAQGFYLHLNGYEGNTVAYVDNFRLVTKDGEKKPKYELLNPINKLTAKLYKVFKTPAMVGTPDNLKCDTSSVEKLGPIVVSTRGRFGLGGITYNQTCRRGVAAYDNNRIVFLSKYGGDEKSSRMINPKSVGCRGTYAHATFDGGKTWGGIQPGEELPTHLNTWYGRSGASADSKTGRIYMTGTENCQSYQGGYDTFFRSLGFDGKKWAPERVSTVDNNMQKCPWWCHVIRLKSGRLWSCWCDGRVTRNGVGFPAKYSDDGGLTWFPCRNADSKELPAPLYKPDLKDIDKAHEKAPEHVIQMPAGLIPGPMMAAYKDGVISVSPYGDAYSIHDGKNWDVVVENVSKAKKWKRVPAFGKRKHYNTECSVTSVDDKHVFVARGGNYSFNFYLKKIKRGKGGVAGLENGQITDLAVAHLDGDSGKWTNQTLETEGVWDSIMTSSGKNAYCFYVKFILNGEDKTWEVRYRRWTNGTWEPSVLVTTQKARVNRLAAPQHCPSSYAMVLWDHIILKGEPGPGGIRFARTPNQ